MPKSTFALKATVSRRQAADPADQTERLLQAAHHEAAENAATTEQEMPTATPEPAPVSKAKHDPHALQTRFLTGNLGKSIIVFTLNGVRLIGWLKQFDQFTLLLQGQDGIDSLVFKHAITMVVPVSTAKGE